MVDVSVLGQLQPYLDEILLSAVVITLVLGIRYAARRWRKSHQSAMANRRIRVVVSGSVALVTGVGLFSLIVVWGLWDILVSVVDGLWNSDANSGSSLIARVTLAVVLLGTAYALTSFIGRVISELTSGTDRISEHQREIIYRLTQVTLYAVVGLVVLSIFLEDLGSLLVGAGFLGIVVGMAARQTLGAVLAGFVLMFSRPFEIGDWVQIGDQEGIVTDITIVNTRLQTFDGEMVVLPNDEVSSQAITNRTHKGRLRLEVEIGVDYDADPQEAAEIARDALDEVEEILDVPTPQVVLKRFDDSAVVLGVRAWIGEPSARRKWRARTAMISAVKTAFERESIKIPFPQRELTGREESGGFRLTGERPAREVRSEAAPDGGEE
ncbi:mechanosensitive ion channel family protein [Salinirubrum litoreum]|uniref:Mechanosensitive ion channel family protein n=1 Tax=Salinirubrum litoreum TaxID=1126234 RepID=A0ABD5R6Y0_9EURY|nr:mechanosensitive ion channel family protein [Salinirubrum litoreum]